MQALWKNRFRPEKYAHPSYHRSSGSSGDFNDVLIDPAEDWSQALWSRDHFQTRELVFNRFPKHNFEIAAVGRSARSWPASRESGFQKFIKNWSEPITLYTFSCRIRICNPNRPKINPGPDFDRFLFPFFLVLKVDYRYILSRFASLGPSGRPKVIDNKNRPPPWKRALTPQIRPLGCRPELGSLP